MLKMCKIHNDIQSISHQNVQQTNVFDILHGDSINKTIALLNIFVSLVWIKEYYTALEFLLDALEPLSGFEGHWRMCAEKLALPLLLSWLLQ